MNKSIFFVVSFFITNLSFCSEQVKTITITSKNYNLENGFFVGTNIKQYNGVCLSSKSYVTGKTNTYYEYVETPIHSELLVALNRLDNAQLKLIFYKNLLESIEDWAITFEKEEDNFFSIQNEDGVIVNTPRQRTTLAPFAAPEDQLMALTNPANEYYTTIFKFE